MANPTAFPGDLIVSGDVRFSGALSPTKARTKVLAISELCPFVIPWTWWRVWDAYQTNLPGTAAADDLALVGGTFATGSPSIQGMDCGGTAVEGFARALIPLPWDYADGQTVTLRFHAGMLTTVADGDAELDVIVHETDEELGIGADICATTIQTINSLTLADIDFTITPTTLVAGDLLDVRIELDADDAGNLGVMIPVIGSVKLLYDAR